MGGSSSNSTVLISEIVASLREKCKVPLYLLDTFNFQKVRKMEQPQSYGNILLKAKPTLQLEMTQAIQDCDENSRFVRLTPDQRSLNEVAQ